MMKGFWKKAFSAEHFKIDHQTANIFVKSQWQLQDGISVPYLIYRAVVAIFFLAVFIVSLVGISMMQTTSVPGWKWLIYLTNWGITMCTIQAIVALVIVSIAKLKEKHQVSAEAGTDTMPLHYKIYWAIHTIATTAAVCITISYWSVVYKPGQHPLDAVNILTHAMNGIMMTIDLLIIAHPLRIGHMYLPLFFAFVYVIFSGIYYLAGGTDRFGRTYIYDILNWEKTGYAFLACLLGLIFIAVMHSALAGINAACRYLVKFRWTAKHSDKCLPY
ncbi:protein rolling stone-like isoform X1 [Schistocerca gregaria]|uniref:protein rolling stone-like isoform X1 n=1 Tax=Schistocerca gregaria TaxID=7010 RepID=UPI00211E0BFF|nr:protein rolling stone-like isoform X1 [Schistocerca gregaria]XP_049831523.1 protein rolling stone-like isoform X1 [Schistocerca gregaria]XP_049831524.1 protein rolling stone-like isoform X1 [Schistocerca gregaria]XP_049831525.1 protein rolling stone-like isoform X1 [Schistocerca gregaria]XP_049831526.1 protein rolling stone-like isoform X1 [Schistocerca gregaria]XP_049831527.1 protein rolling stone-like isoform X1 [Schistocerca gregaria]XP_049831528.1 protein rolling stone-like isoform X1 